MYTLYCGLDLAIKDSQLAWATPTGEIVREHRMPLTRRRLEEVFAPYRGQVLVGCEATTNAFWLHDVLSALGVDVKIAPPYQLKVVSHTCYKTDRVDARKMARLLAKDLFPSIWVPPVQLRDLRELNRLRVQLVRSRTQWVCRHHALLHRWGLASAHEGAEVLADAEACTTLGPGARGADEEVLRTVRALHERIRAVEQEIDRKVREAPAIHDVVKLLKTIPGVGTVTATTLALEVGRIDRFARPKPFFRYCRLTPGVRQSGNVKRELPLAKDARQDLGWLLVEGAWVAQRTDPYFGRQYRRRVEAGMKPCRAIIPVARSLAHAVYLVWSRQKPYSELFPQKKPA